MSFLNESLKIESAVKEGGYSVPLSISNGDSAKFEFYNPSNTTVAPNRIPDGTWPGIITDEELGEFYYDIPENILDEIGDWVIQPYIIKDGTRQTGQPYCHTVTAKGLGCGFGS